MREKTIMINDAPFTYMDEVGDPYVFNAMTQEDMANILALGTTLLKECGIEFFLAFGTLLGSVREGSFIKGDDDVDIIVADEEKLYENLPFLAEHGLFINRIFKTELYTFHSEGRKGHIDMYIMRPIDKWVYRNWCVSIRGHYAPKRFFDKGIDAESYSINGINYPCPKHSEDLLKWWYGKTWRIPQAGKATEDVWLRRFELFPEKYWRKGRKYLKNMFGK